LLVGRSLVQVRRLQLERHDATRAAVAAEAAALDAKAAARQATHALRDADQQRRAATEAHAAAEAENAELRRAVASEVEDKRAALAFRAAVEQEHAAAWAAAQQQHDARTAAQAAAQAQQEAQHAAQQEARARDAAAAAARAKAVHARELLALQHQCRDLGLQVANAQREVADSEAARQALVLREGHHRAAAIAALEAKAIAEAEKHEVRLGFFFQACLRRCTKSVRGGAPVRATCKKRCLTHPAAFLLRVILALSDLASARWLRALRRCPSPRRAFHR
jgi:hypothetical protein